jgi:hypothetical protein
MTSLKATAAVITIAPAGLALHSTVGAEQPQAKAGASQVRVGGFDSRTLGIAYYRNAIRPGRESS